MTDVKVPLISLKLPVSLGRVGSTSTEKVVMRRMKGKVTVER